MWFYVLVLDIWFIIITHNALGYVDPCRPNLQVSLLVLVFPNQSVFSWSFVKEVDFYSFQNYIGAN